MTPLEKSQVRMLANKIKNDLDVFANNEEFDIDEEIIRKYCDMLKSKQAIQDFEIYQKDGLWYVDIIPITTIDTIKLEYTIGVI